VEVVKDNELLKEIILKAANQKVANEAKLLLEKRSEKVE
jgi:hypothetical protein